MKIFLFGPPRLERDGQPVQIKRRKGLAMLSYLAVTAKSHSRDALAALFWAEFDRSKARSNLRRELAALNKTLGKEQLSVDREQIGLNSVANLWLDVEQFQTQLAQCDMHGHPTTDICSECIPPLRHAVNVYSQDFLAGFSLTDSPEFDEWQFFQSESLRQQLAGALEKLTQALCAQEDFSAAIPYARRWAQLDPLHEPAQHQLMLVYAQAGQRTAAWRHYEIYASMLKIELDVAPGEEISALYQYAR